METGFLEKVVWKVEPERWTGGVVERSRENIGPSKCGVLSAEWGAPAPVTCPLCSKRSVRLCGEEGRKEAGQE